jgi:membrane-associated phospholipid phosphatase
MAGFVVLAAVAGDGWSPLQRLDQRIALDLNDYIAPRGGQAHFWRLVSDVLSPGVLRAALLLVAAVLLSYRRLRHCLLCVGVVLGSLVLVDATKAAVGRPRPHVPHPVAYAPGASYPSGHALTSAAVCLTVVVVVWPAATRRIRIATVVAAAMVATAVAFSRMILGVHYLSDVIGSWLGATALVFFLVAALSRGRLNRWREPSPRVRDADEGSR